MSERPEVPRDADERATPTAMLAWLRNAVVRKTTGIDRDTAQGPKTASGMDLLGVVRHLARTRSGGGSGGASPGRTWTCRGRTSSLRWVLVHMIEETARHAGHADLFREHIDGLVGE